MGNGRPRTQEPASPPTLPGSNQQFEIYSSKSKQQYTCAIYSHLQQLSKGTTDIGS
ncbi:uncharacterized protein An12g04850 [Aspergillus niger]|uniref:Contig An12c0130, genomic contig n=2 Tax=Aspergillus niger TaxID=5061 RepID=A2QZG6_ASPNC|nr:uncharacterized protein An12g04850 [Aspergillus niger]CAK97176.1 unnamed protein product [Aspergillus niger]